MANIQYVTKEGLEKLREDLHQLETFEGPKISQQIADARDKGDLSENAEYDAAKEAQGMLEMQIAKLKEVVGSARVIDESKLDHSKVSILSKVVNFVPAATVLTRILFPLILFASKACKG